MAAAGARIADRYVLASLIGAGGMGVVWRAYDARLERDVAVKLLPAGIVGDAAARARLLREARAAGSLHHEGIVHIYDVGDTDDGSAYLVMELVTGQTLRAALDAGELSRSQRIEVICQVARALSAAHAAGLVHRDVKPENIVLRRDSGPILLDFGLAKPIPQAIASSLDSGTDPQKITVEGVVVGTPAFLAPEQIRGETVGPAADQFALAVTAFELLTGRRPFEGTSVITVLAAILRDRPPLASTVTHDVSREVADVLDRAMRSAPGERWPNVAAFADALTAAAAGEKPQTPRSHRALVLATVGGVLALAAGTRLLLGASGPDATRAAGGADGAEAGATHLTSGSIPGTNAVVACPLFTVPAGTVDEPAGWLGAAVAALACERAQVLLGGDASRALGPADLGGFPRDATDQGSVDPYAPPEMRDRIERAARERGDVRIVGTLQKEARDYAVKVSLRSRDDHEVARATGRGFEIAEAVSAALRATAPAFGGTLASAFQREWLRVDTKEAALDLLDLATALVVEDDVMTAAACTRVAKRTDVRADMLYLARELCHERLERRPLDDPPPPVDASSPATLATSVAAQRARGGPDAVRRRVALLEQALADTEDPEQRVILAATAAEVLYAAGDAPRAQVLSRNAIYASPKLVDLRGIPWHRLTFTGGFDSHVAAAHATWVPWEPVALQNIGMDGSTPYLNRVKLVGRAAVLGRRGYFVSSYAELLARAGRTVEAQGIADQLDSDLLRVRVLIGEARYRSALERGGAALAALPPTDEKAGTAFRLASAMAEAARYLGRPSPFVDGVVERYLDPEPPHVRIGVVPFIGLVHACTAAAPATGKRCIRRLQQLYARGDLGGLISAAPVILEGAKRWVAGDVEGAAKAWRPLMRETATWEIESIRHVMAEAFDRSGMSDLGARLDADVLGLVDQPGAMDLAFVRGAFRAERAGEASKAKKLATVVLAKWQTADDDIPATREVKALLERVSRDEMRRGR